MKKNVKRILSLALALCMVFALTSCGSSSSSSAAPAADTKSETAAASTAAVSESSAEAAPAAEAPAGEVIKWKIDYPNPENSCWYPLLVNWADWIREQSGGRLDITIYPNGQLGSIMDCVTNVESGVTDGCWSSASLYPGVWPLTEMFCLPMLGPKGGDGGMEPLQEAMQDIMKNETFLSQFDNVHMLLFHTADPGATIFKDKVSSMKEIQGKTMRAMNTYGATWIEALGGTPVSISSNDGYENISKNVIDGGFWFFDQIESSALYEVIKTVIYGEAMYSPLFLCVGNEPYNALPDDLKAIVDDSAQVFLDSVYPAVYAQQERVLKYLEDAGVELILTSDEDLEWMREAAPVAWQTFVDNVSAQGYDGQAILDEFMGYIQKHNAEWEGKNTFPLNK